MDKKCSIWWCDRKHYAKGYCHAHWITNRRTGTPYGKDAQAISKMQSRIDELEVNLKLAVVLLDLYREKQRGLL
jgi:hypothetical protein